MKFFDIFDKKAEKGNWPEFFINLIDFLGELQWVSNSDDKLQDTYFSVLSEEDINGGLKIIISVIKSDDTHCTINAEHHEDISVMSVYCLMDDNGVQLYGFYKHNKKIETVISGKESNRIKSKFKDLHDKLINLRTK